MYIRFTTFDSEELGQNIVTSFMVDPFQFQGKEGSWNQSFFQQLGLLQELGKNDFEKIGSTILRYSQTCVQRPT